MTCAKFNFQQNLIKNQIKIKAFLCKFEILNELKIWTSNENLPKTKVVDLEILHTFGIQHFFIWAPEKRENFSLPRDPWDFKNYRKVPFSISLSVPPPLARTPPVDLVHSTPAGIWAQESRWGHLDVRLASPRAYKRPWPLGKAPRRPPCAAPPPPVATSPPSVPRSVRPPLEPQTFTLKCPRL